MSNKDKKPETPAEAPKAGQDVALKTTGSQIAEADFGTDAGEGLQNVKAEERSIPFFRILQTNNPQVADPRQGGMPGAKPGMILNLGSGELYDGIDGIEFIPCYRDHNFPEWTPREAGGGFVTIRSDDDPLVLELQSKFGKFGKLPNGVTKRNDKGQALDGTELTETYYLYGLIGPEQTPGLIAFTSTQIKKYKAFMNRVTSFKYKQGEAAVVPPIYAHRWWLQVVPESNKSGNFFGWRLTLAGKNEDKSEAPYIQSMIPRSNPDYQAAKALHDIIKEGKAIVDHKQAGTNEEETETPM